MTIALQYSEPMCPFKDHPSEPIDPLENEVSVLFNARESFARDENEN